MIGPVFGIVGFLCGYYLAQKRGGKTLDRLQYGAGFGIAFGLFGTLLGIALARFSWGGLIGETSPALNSSPLCRLNL